MIKKRIQYLETPSGIGEISENGKLIANVSYRIKVYEELVEITTISNAEKIQGPKTIYGTIYFIESIKDLSGFKNIVLTLQDGRRLDILINNLSLTNNKARIQATGNFY